MLDKPLAILLDGPSAADADTSWVQIAKTGRFKDPRYGQFSITRADFAKWIRNFNSFSVTEGRLGLPVDVDHSPEKKGDTEAFGWVKQLEQRGNEMWAKVEWNEQGKTLIASRRYAYISPSYSPDYKDEKGDSHGTALVGIALTNRPFLQMATVNLSDYTFAANDGDADDKGSGSGNDNDADDVGLKPGDATDLDGLPDGYKDPHALDDLMLDISDAARQKHAVVVKKINGQTRHMFPIPPGDKGHARAALRLLPRATKAGHITSQEADAIRARARGVLGKGKSSTLSIVNGEPYSLEQMELDNMLTTIGLSRETLGLAADADEATVLTALKGRMETPKPPAAPEGAVTLSAANLKTLTEQAAQGVAAAEELRVSKFDTAFGVALNDGKVTPAMKDTYRTLYDADSGSTIKLLSELQTPVVHMTPLGSGGQPGDTSQRETQLAGAYNDVVTPLSVDPEGLKVLSAAEELQATRKIPFEQALELAQSGVRA